MSGCVSWLLMSARAPEEPRRNSYARPQQVVRSSCSAEVPSCGCVVCFASAASSTWLEQVTHSALSRCHAVPVEVAMIERVDEDRKLSLAEAARQAGVDRQTVRRRLEAAGVDLEPHRTKGGKLTLPVRVLIAAGVPVGRPAPPPVEPAADVLADLAAARERAAVAEARLAALEQVIAAKQETIDAQAMALKMLGTGEPAPRRGWLRR